MRLINLEKISSFLPSLFASGVAVLSLGGRLIKLGDSAWELGSLVREGRFSDGGGLSAQGIALVAKVALHSIKLASSVLTAGALLLGWCFSPILFISVSTVSLGVSLITQFNRY